MNLKYLVLLIVAYQNILVHGDKYFQNNILMRVSGGEFLQDKCMGTFYREDNTCIFKLKMKKTYDANPNSPWITYRPNTRRHWTSYFLCREEDPYNEDSLVSLIIRELFWEGTNCKDETVEEGRTFGLRFDAILNFESNVEILEGIQYDFEFAFRGCGNKYKVTLYHTNLTSIDYSTQNE